MEVRLKLVENAMLKYFRKNWTNRYSTKIIAIKMFAATLLARALCNINQIELVHNLNVDLD